MSFVSYLLPTPTITDVAILSTPGMGIQRSRAPLGKTIFSYAGFVIRILVYRIHTDDERTLGEGQTLSNKKNGLLSSKCFDASSPYIIFLLK